MNDNEEEQDLRPLVILGAGFSRAIQASMPLMSDLRSEVLQRLQLDPAMLAPFSDDIEQWLSSLAVDQPWQDEATNLDNRARFLRVTAAIGDAIEDKERETLDTPPPQWLLKLVTHWAATGTTIVTFNYDLLVERALGHLGIAPNVVDLYRGPMTLRGITGGLTYGVQPPNGPVPAILKVHGSTNWGYNPTATDAPIVITEESANWRSSPNAQTILPRNIGLHDDLAPMMVPPMSSKSTYYSGAILRSQWRRASIELKRCTSLTVIGYSFPKTDYTSRQFVSQLPSGPPVTTVDYNPEMQVTIQELLPGRQFSPAYSGADAVARYTDDLTGSLVQAGIHYEKDGNIARIVVDGETVSESAPGPSHDATAFLQRELSECVGTEDWMNLGSFYRRNGLCHWVGGHHLVYTLPEAQSHEAQEAPNSRTL